MQISVDGRGIILFPENSEEDGMLNGSYLPTKLAYERAKGSGIPIIYRPNTFKTDSKTNSVIMPRGLSQSEFCYALRIIGDGMALDEGIIPLHGACIADKTLKVLLFGKSGAGKSYFAYKAAYCEGFSIIGDDHILISKNKVIGNNVMRIRSPKTPERTVPTLYNSILNPKRSIGVFLAKDTTDKFTRLPLNSLREMLKETSALKYLVDTPSFIGKPYNLNSVFGVNKIQQYMDALRCAAFSFDSIYALRGSHTFLKESIKHLLKRK